MLVVGTGNLCGGGEGDLISASIKIPVCGIGGGDCVVILVWADVG